MGGCKYKIFKVYRENVRTYTHDTRIYLYMYVYIYKKKSRLHCCAKWRVCVCARASAETPVFVPSPLFSRGVLLSFVYSQHTHTHGLHSGDACNTIRVASPPNVCVCFTSLRIIVVSPGHRLSINCGIFSFWPCSVEQQWPGATGTE